MLQPHTAGRVSRVEQYGTRVWMTSAVGVLRASLTVADLMKKMRSQDNAGQVLLQVVKS